MHSIYTVATIGELIGNVKPDIIIDDYSFFVAIRKYNK